MARGTEETIFIGFGETTDPFPDEPKTTLFWVFAGPCQKCGFSTRFLLPEARSIFLICRKCGNRQESGIGVRYWPQITYIHWCRESRFASDELHLSPETRAQVEALTIGMNPDVDTPAWGVRIIGGECIHGKRCINLDCPYHFCDKTGGGNIVFLATRRARKALKK